MEQIYVKDYGIRPGDHKKNTLYLRKMLQQLEAKEDISIEFEQDTYHFYPDYAEEVLLCIPNHDEDTIKKVAFYLHDRKKVRISGNGAQFIFHTEIIPFCLQRCEDVSLQGFTVDYGRPGYSQGVILETEDKRMRFQIDADQYPYEIRARRLYFQGENYEHELLLWLEMDQDRKAPVYCGHDIYFSDMSICMEWKEIEKGVIEVILPEEKDHFLSTSREGNVVVFRHHPRNNPGIFLMESRRTLCEDIIMHHATGMGLVALACQEITVRRFDVLLNNKENRYFTTVADAAHFVFCTGLIHVDGCTLENQLDDPVNVHGIYARIREVLSPKEVIAELVERQQKGVKIGDRGDHFALIDPETLLEITRGRAEKVERLNKDFIRVCFEESLQDAKAGQSLENKDLFPDVCIENCTFRNNRARGILVTTQGRVLIRNNLFQVPGAGVLIEGDCNYWFESGAAKEVHILNNTFEDCAYVPDWGKAPIQITPGVRKIQEGVRYHKKIVIEGNTFSCFDDRLLYAENVEEIDWKDNKVLHTKTFPPIEGETFVLKNIIDWNHSDIQ